jgi:hypothetical protein
MAENSINTPGSSVQDIVSYFASKGIQKSNKFSITITPPSALSALTAYTGEVFATSIQTPSRSILYYPDTMNPSGPIIQVPLRRLYDDRFIIEFMVDQQWNIASFFQKWMNLITSDTSSKLAPIVRYYDDITGKIVITALDPENKVGRTITLYGAWPKTIIPNTMSNDMVNQYLTLMVDMNYRYSEYT